VKLMAEKSISNPRPAYENADERILAHNLDEMRSPMMRLLTVESIGGNAGFVEINGRKIPCAAARGFADAQSGEIIDFGNFQNIPGKTRNAYPEFIFRIAVDLRRRNPFYRIVESSFDASFTAKARKLLQESVERWNAQSAIRSRGASRSRSSSGLRRTQRTPR
jgi:hypothetical protein